jgi:hypothetical protein
LAKAEKKIRPKYWPDDQIFRRKFCFWLGQKIKIRPKIAAQKIHFRPKFWADHQIKIFVVKVVKKSTFLGF